MHPLSTNPIEMCKYSPGQFIFLETCYDVATAVNCAMWSNISRISHILSSTSRLLFESITWKTCVSYVEGKESALVSHPENMKAFIFSTLVCSFFKSCFIVILSGLIQITFLNDYLFFALSETILNVLQVPACFKEILQAMAGLYKNDLQAYSYRKS